jgi:RNA polymerase sigma-70 factor (ECF subfamily)
MICLVLPDVAEDDRRLTRARNGDKDALAAIYQAYFEPVYQFVRLRVGAQQLAEDLTADVFTRLVQSLQGDNPPHTSLRGWIFRVARHVIYDHYGQQPELPSDTLEQWLVSDENTDPEVQAIRTLEVERLRHALRMLVPAQQEVLLLRFDQQLSLKETADIMDKNVNAIKALQFRAVNTLRGILADSTSEDDTA